MPPSDDHHRLNARQRREIDQIGPKWHFNLAPPPRYLDEMTWKYSNLDIVDRQKIEHLAPEDFWCYIGKSESERPLEEPGELSAVTMDKAIKYGVNLLGSFIEA
jgi:hypothetical protein